MSAVPPFARAAKYAIVASVTKPSRSARRVVIAGMTMRLRRYTVPIRFGVKSSEEVTGKFGSERVRAKVTRCSYAERASVNRRTSAAHGAFSRNKLFVRSENCALRDFLPLQSVAL